MEHLETWPNLFIKNKTYIPVHWDMSNLEEVLGKVIENYEDHIRYVKNSQSLYKNILINGNKFVKKFINMLN